MAINNTLTPTSNGGYTLPQNGLMGVTGNSAPGVSSGGLSGLVPVSAKPAMTLSGTTGINSIPATSSAPQSTYQQNLSKYGLTSIPAGYSFNASGQLKNLSGQEYAAPASATSSTPPPAYVAPPTPIIPPNASINSGGGNVTAPSVNTPNNPNTATGSTFGNAVGTLAQTSSQTNPAYDQAVTDYQKAQQSLQESQTNEANTLALNSENPIPLEFQQGRGQVIQTQYLSQQDALAKEMTAAQGLGQIGTAQQGTQQSGLGTAAGLVSPTQVPYSNQYLSPVTGQPVGGGGTTGGTALSSLPQQAQSAVQSYAQQVQSGSMTRADAESRLSAYGVAGTNALNEVLGNGFNTNASNASAGTTAVGQQIQTAANSTNQALDTLGSSFSSLNGLQTGGIPTTNSIAQWIGAQLGDSALTQYKTNLADARSQLLGVLNSSGGTPTGNEATANEYLPDNMTKAQFDANVGTAQNPGKVRTLIAQKVGSYTQSGTQNGTTNTNSGSVQYNSDGTLKAVSF